MVFETFSQHQFDAACRRSDQRRVGSVGLGHGENRLDGRHANPNPMYEDHQDGEKRGNRDHHDNSEDVGDLPKGFYLGIHVSLPALYGHA